MGIVVALPDPTVAQDNALGFELVTEPSLKFGTVVGLYHLETKAKLLLCPHNEGKAGILFALRAVFGVRSTRVQVNERVDVEPRAVFPRKVNGIHLHQVAWPKGWWPLHEQSFTLPLGATLEQLVPGQGAFHGAKADCNAFLRQSLVNDFGTALTE